MTADPAIPGLANVQYVETSDGVPIAATVSGSGPTVVYLPAVPWITMRMPDPLRPLLEATAPPLSGWRAVLYDARGFGLSDGSSPDLDPEAQIRDLEAVADQVTTGRVALVATLHSGATAVRYVVRHPERVSALVLWGTHPSGDIFVEGERMKTVRGLLKAEWGLFLDTLALRLLGWQAAGATDELSRLIGDAINQSDAARCIDALAADDVTELLGQVQTPTLVLGRVPGYIGTEIPRELAWSIPTARLAFAKGSAIAPQLRDSSDVCLAIERFLAEVAG